MDHQATIDLTIDESEGTWEDLVRDLLAGDLGPSEELTAKKRGPISSWNGCMTCWDCSGRPGGC